ncbi:MAG: hypothetical protein Q9161_005942 [Pseudevernia consocians]
MGNSPSREAVCFGIELELTGIPHNVGVSPSKYLDYKRAGFRNLQSRMEKLGVKTIMDPVKSNGKFTKYPENYDQWNLQQDSSIKLGDEYAAISIEAVSRKFFVPDKDWMREIESFWQAFDEVFEQEKDNESCGSHVHVRPGGQGYDMEGLRSIAYAVVVYEKHVLEFLPEERRNHHYCQPNTEVSPKLKRIFRRGRSKASYDDLKDQIYDIDTPEELCTFMQGDQDGNRRVLWNFDNVCSGRIGTVEFRGGPVLHTPDRTIHWILFAVGFILLATQEDKLSTGNFSYVEPGTPLFRQRASELWARIRDCTGRRITQKWSLPYTYEAMNGHGSSSAAISDSEPDESEPEKSEPDESEPDESEPEESEPDDSEPDDAAHSYSDESD